MKSKLTNCKVCGKELAKGVKKCTDCGKDQRNFFLKHKILTAFLILVIFASIGLGDSNTNNSSEANNTEQKVEQSSENESIEEVADEVATEENVPTEHKSALKKAKIYSDTMSMSKEGIYDQLTSEYGEQFSKEAAQYAIDNVEANWKENALKKAKTYQEEMAMSPNAIYDQLISDYGEKFTEEEAQYAIDNIE